jgi:integrase/recombinase XerD
MGDVNLASASVRCIGRGSRERVIPLYRRCVGALEAYIEQGRDRLLKDPRERSLFLNHRGERLTRQGLWLIIKGYVESAGISSEVTPHTLRHSFAIHMLDGGVDLGNVQRLLGHANRSTTRVYAQVSSEWPTRVYDDAHPRTH